LLHKSYNETIAVSGARTTALGIKPSGSSITFKLYPGKFSEELMRSGELRLFASGSSKEYVEASLTKDLELTETPVGSGPKSWYLAVACREVRIEGNGPWRVNCDPARIYFRPSPPPSRGFYYILEAAVFASRAFLDIANAQKALKILEEGERIFDEDDKEAARKIRLYLVKLLNRT